VTQLAAPRSSLITLVTTFVLLLTAGFAIAAAWNPALWVGAAVLGVICVVSYLLAPVSYSLEDGWLIVRSRVHDKVFGPVVRCTRLSESDRFPRLIGLRLFGNGGIFAGVGWFWNRMLGVFRAYVTSARRDDLVVLYTAAARAIVISPEDSEGFVQHWASNR
jgi:hypothetical protein